MICDGMTRYPDRLDYSVVLELGSLDRFDEDALGRSFEDVEADLVLRQDKRAPVTDVAARFQPVRALSDAVDLRTADSPQVGLEQKALHDRDDRASGSKSPPNSLLLALAMR